MVSQQKVDKSSQQRIDDRQASCNSENASSNSADNADELIDALDTLLLERAVKEHRDALARLNKLKMALDREGTGDAIK